MKKRNRLLLILSIISYTDLPGAEKNKPSGPPESNNESQEIVHDYLPADLLPIINDYTQAGKVVVIEADKPFRATVFNPDGTMIATLNAQEGTSDVRIFDAYTGTLLRPMLEYARSVQAIAFSPQGDIVTGDSNGVIRFLNATTGELIQEIPTHIPIASLAISPQGNTLVFVDMQGVAYIYDRTTTKLRRFKEGVRLIAFSPDENSIAGASDYSQIRIWNLQTKKTISIKNVHQTRIVALAFSPDGKKLATASDDRTACIWNAQTGALEHKLIGHTAALTGVVFSPDGTKLATSSRDRTMRLWDVHTGKELQRFEGYDAEVGSVVFSPDGSRIAITSGTTLYIQENTPRLVAAPQSKYPVNAEEKKQQAEALIMPAQQKDIREQLRKLHARDEIAFLLPRADFFILERALKELEAEQPMTFDRLQKLRQEYSRLSIKVETVAYLLDEIMKRIQLPDKRPQIIQRIHALINEPMFESEIIKIVVQELSKSPSE